MSVIIYLQSNIHKKEVFFKCAVISEKVFNASKNIIPCNFWAIHSCVLLLSAVNITAGLRVQINPYKASER